MGRVGLSGLVLGESGVVKRLIVGVISVMLRFGSMGQILVSSRLTESTEEFRRVPNYVCVPAAREE